MRVCVVGHGRMSHASVVARSGGPIRALGHAPLPVMHVSAVSARVRRPVVVVAVAMGSRVVCIKVLACRMVLVVPCTPSRGGKRRRNMMHRISS